jgi:hypothetical protein
MLPHISPINTYKGVISSYLLEVLCRGVQDRMFLLSSCIQDICWIVEKYPARFRVLFKYINVFFLTYKEGLSLTAAELHPILDVP